jgi:N-acyl-D-aspartate/D-glutamate deacylase
MRTYVLVHGGGHGGWCYQRVARLMRSRGHDVYAPTMTGLGERAHLLSPAVDLDVRIAAYRDPAWRARAAADLEQAPMKPRWETFEVSESERFPELVGRRVGELARERGSSPLDVMCEVAVAEDLETRFRAYIG